MKNILITGGGGFIGSHLIKRLLDRYPHYSIIVLDKEKSTTNICEFNDKIKVYNYEICNDRNISKLFELYTFDGVFHLASEKPHRDADLSLDFLKTNVLGTSIIINNCLKYNSRLLHASTNEVYGNLEMDKRTHTYESHCYNPTTIYGASKASSDHIIKAYHKQYGLDAVIATLSNVYGPNQGEDNFLPTIIKYLLSNKPVPVFGNGEHIRDWLYIDDCAEGLDAAFHKGLAGECYNFGGDVVSDVNNNELVNITSRIINRIKMFDDSGVAVHKLINYMSDFSGHDMRHSVNYDKSTLRLKWKPKTKLEEGLLETINWGIDKYENGINNSV